MPFLQIRKSPPSAKGRPAVNRVSLTVTAAHVQISLSSDLFDALGRPKNISISVGTGAEVGQFIIAPDPAGWKTSRVSPKAHQFRAQVPHKGFGVRRGQKMTPTGHSFTKDGLLVSYRVDIRPTRANGAHPVPQPENDPGFTRYAN